MCRKFTNSLLVLVHILATFNTISCQNEAEVVEKAWLGVLQAMNWTRIPMKFHGSVLGSSYNSSLHLVLPALSDCARLYEDTEPRLAKLVSGNDYTGDDALTWLSAAASSHRSCFDGFLEKGLVMEAEHQEAYNNLTIMIEDALAFYANKKYANYRDKSDKGVQYGQNLQQNEGLLASWTAASFKADIVVAQDGSGSYNTINGAVDALEKMGENRPQRVIIYVKSGVYEEKVDIKRGLKNVMFVGDGMDKTVVTGDGNVKDGDTTLNSATFGVSGDGFWARDMTFENKAGPEKHQAVALKVASDLSLFYRCSIKGYQDTLLVHSLRQFYRDCHIYGTIDYIFGNAAAVFQNCDIYVRKPMEHQGNMITAQGRQNPQENTGISIISSRVLPAPDLSAVKNEFRTYLGRPWKEYSRTVILESDLDGLIDPKGWTEWSGDFALSTLYYGEYMNTGNGAETAHRVTWPGFHVIKDSNEASSFAANNFINGDQWIPISGVPFSPGI